MVPLAPLFGAIPGGAELVVILVVLVFLFGVPLFLLLGGGALGAKLVSDRSGAEDERRLERLEEELAETKAELRELREREEGAPGEPDGDAEPTDQTESRSS